MATKCFLWFDAKEIQKKGEIHYPPQNGTTTIFVLIRQPQPNPQNQNQCPFLCAGNMTLNNNVFHFISFAPTILLLLILLLILGFGLDVYGIQGSM